MIRAFIAIELKDQDTIDNISSFSSRLKQNQPKLKLVKPENLHMTVKFLGDISETLAPKIYTLLQKKVNQTIFKEKKFEYTLIGVGQFNRFSILWIKLIGNIQFLQKVKDTVENVLYEELNVEKDKRTKFQPHLTIGRLKRNKINYKTFDTLKNLISQNKNLEFGTFIISQVKLKRSILTPEGPIYSDLVY
ncbi:MAG: RNA 2',3'-cyclic phosphodiesterase [Promethearchaeota archaeon]